MNASTIENSSSTERTFVFLFRMLMAWTFLYAASHQVFNSNFTVAGFLSHTKTFHNIYAPLASSALSPMLTLLVSYGHLLIGLSLLFGLLVLVSAAFGAALLMMYWTAHMDWPFISDHNNFIVDFHIVYALLCIYLIHRHAGHVWGLDAWAEKRPAVQERPALHGLVA